jgi:23S rRNA U2552 (ribose-2'-O)-methylase RlmE/FtsJ
MDVPPTEDLYRVSAYPKSLEQFILYKIFEDHLLDKGWDVHPLNYTKVLFAATISPTCIRYSFRPAEELFLTPSDGHARVAGQMCKASGKLTEALFVSGFEPRKGGVAIDLGAAPGGWTAVLAETMDTVVAVDPAELLPDVLALPNVVHIKKTSQEATEDILAMLGKQETSIDLLVSDMNRHPEQMHQILKPLLGVLCSGGMIILTMKFRGKGKDKVGWEEKLKEALGPEFNKVKILWLLANTENERTAVAVKI